MSKVIRSVKNVTKGYSAVQVKVRNATTNDPWGPTGTEMAEISQMTYSSSNEFYEIMDMLDKRLNDKGKNWRHVLKALKVLDYCLHEGSELAVTWARKNIYIIKTLREFQYIDEDGHDVGHNVRVSAKELTSLILDEDRLRAERNDRMSWKSRVTGIEDYQSSGSPPRRPGERQQRVQRTDEEDAEYKLAIEASKYQEEEDRKKRESRQGEPDDDLAKAIKLSKEEEDLRRRELEESNELSLFDGDPIQTPQPQYTGFNQGYQQQGAVDWAGNPIDQAAMMQSQPTGFLNTMYNSSPVTFQVQPANYQNGVSNSFGAHQSGFDPYGQQQTSPFTTTPTGYNPYTQQQQQNLSQQSLQQQQQLEPVIPPSTNPWAVPQQQSSLAPMPTGSNNPFASSVSNNRTFPTSTNSQPTLSTLQEQKTLGQLSNTPSFTTPTSFPATAQMTQTSFPATSQKTQTSYEAKLSSLLESGEGMDTFGNTGNLRIPAQHTAPGTFVNSAGAGLNRITEQQTSTNPFLPSQFTGMPPTTYAGQSGSLVGRQFPAATGPAGIGTSGFGASGSSNPFGQRQQQNGQSGDLIQF